MPICWLAAAAWRSASAISGRRSSRAEGKPTGIARRSDLNGRARNGELRGRLAGQNGDGVFQLRALDSQVGQLRLRGVELGFGLRHVGIGSHAAGEAVAGEHQILLVGLDGLLEQRGIAIEPVQLEIVLGELGLIEQAGVLEQRREGLGRVGAGGDAAVDAAPDVGRVGSAHRECRRCPAGWSGRRLDSREEACEPVTEGEPVTRGNRAGARHPHRGLGFAELRLGLQARSGWRCSPALRGR